MRIGLFVRRILRDGASPFAAAARELVEDATAAIAEAAGRSFFVARFLATTQAARSTLPDPNDPAWRAALPRDAGPAMRQDLETRLPGQADRAIDLLRPLAYAHGPGLPWEDIWAPLADVLSPTSPPGSRPDRRGRIGEANERGNLPERAITMASAGGSTLAG